MSLGLLTNSTHWKAERSNLHERHEHQLMCSALHISTWLAVQHMLGCRSLPYLAFCRGVDAFGMGLRQAFRCFVIAETALARLEASNMLTNYRINAMGPILVSKVRVFRDMLSGGLIS